MRTIPLIGVLCCVTPFSLAAQLEPPPFGPIFSSLMGPTAASTIYDDVSINTFQALTTALSYSNKDDLRKVNLAPFKLRSDLTSCGHLCETTLNMSSKSGISTFGVGWAYNRSAPYSSKNAAAAAALDHARIPAKRPPAEGESDVEYKEYSRIYRETVIIPQLYTPFMEGLARNSWVVRAAINFQTFRLPGSTEVDLDGDGLVDNKYVRRGWDMSLGGEFTPSLRAGFGLTVHRSGKRAKQVENTPEADYIGGTATAVFRVATLDPNYEQSKAYVKSLFIPSVLLGAGVTYQNCRNSADECDERITSQAEVTPFIDVKVTPEAQFRFGLPIRRVRVAGKGETNAQNTFQFAFQLSGL